MVHLTHMMVQHGGLVTRSVVDRLTALGCYLAAAVHDFQVAPGAGGPLEHRLKELPGTTTSKLAPPLAYARGPLEPCYKNW